MTLSQFERRARSMTDREKRQAARERGDCTACCKNKAHPGLKTCAPCRVMRGRAVPPAKGKAA